jgi:hypothetical protein
MKQVSEFYRGRLGLARALHLTVLIRIFPAASI